MPGQLFTCSVCFWNRGSCHWSEAPRGEDLVLVARPRVQIRNGPISARSVPPDQPISSHFPESTPAKHPTSLLDQQLGSSRYADTACPAAFPRHGMIRPSFDDRISARHGNPSGRARGHLPIVTAHSERSSAASGTATTGFDGRRGERPPYR